jgi:PAS domain S-box-containing protein
MQENKIVKIKNGNVSKTTLIRILHVDDDASILEISKQILNDMGQFEIEHASCVDEAFKKLSSKQYDVIVSDYEMPQKDGLQFLKELHEKENNTPFILFTGKGREEIAIQALNLGAGGYFNKQGNPETVYGELTHGINRVVEHFQVQEALGTSEQKFKTVFEGANDGILLADPDTKRLIFTNPKMCELTGYTPNELIQLSVADIHPKKDLISVLSEFEKQIKGEKELVANCPILKKDGHVIYCDINAKLVNIGNQKLLAGFFRDITERKKTEDALKTSEEKYKQLFSGMPSGVAIYEAVDDGKNFVFKDFNYSAEKIEKISKENVIGKCVTEVFPGVESFGLFKVFQRVWRSGQPEYYPTAIYIDDINAGSWRENWVYKLPNGNIVAIYNEVTERKQAEEKLSKSEALMNHAEKLGKIGGFEFDVNTLAQKWTEETFRILEIDLAHGEPKVPQGIEFINPPYRSMANEAIQRAIKHGEPYEQEWEITTLKGNKRWVHAIGKANWENGKIKTISGSFQDITERKKIETALLESQKKFQDLTETTNDFVWEMDSTSRYTYCSPQIEKLWGIKPSEMIGKSPFDLMPTDERKEKLKFFRENGSTPNPFSIESTAYNSQGCLVFLEINGVPFFNNEGKLLGYRGISRDITERKKHEEEMKKNHEALVESENNYRSLINGMNETAWVIDFEGNFLEVNRAAVEILGYSKEELLAIGIKGIDNYLSQKQVKSLISCLPKMKRQVFETEHTAKNGNAIPVEISSNLITYKGKQAILSIARDISERKHAQELIRISEDRYRSLYGAIACGVVVQDPNGLIVEANDLACTLLGLTRDHLQGRTSTDPRWKAIHEDNSPFLGDEHPAMVTLRTGKPLHNVVMGVFHPTTGQYRWIVINSEPIIDAKTKKVTAAVTTFIDISKRKEAEEKLFQSEKKYREFVDSLPEIVFETNDHGFPIFINNKAFEIMGYSNDEIKHMNLLQFLIPEHRQKAKDNIQRRMQGEKTKGNEYTLKRKDGTSFPAMIFTERILSQEGKPSGLRGVIVNISQNKKINDELKLLNEKLGVVGSLTRHDVGNKLMAAKSNVYLLRKKIGNKLEYTKYLDGVDFALADADRIFEFSRLYAKMGSEKPELVNFEKCFNQAVTMLPALWKIKVVNDCQGLQVLADSLLVQLFYNLLDNSLKHGQKVTQIHLHYCEGVDGVKLFYEDNGIGVSDANKPKIFDKGFTTGKGSGLGLYLIRNMIDAYGWTIEENGEPGKGVRFTITIPKLNKSEEENYQIIP